MSPLERRYRRLLRLLPRDHRGSRGEELVGLLLDIDHGRDRPRLREVLSVVGLAIRLRFETFMNTPAAGAVATSVLSVLLVLWGTAGAGYTLDMYTGAVLPSDMGPLIASWPFTVALALLPLGPLVAWCCGAARTALALFGSALAILPVVIMAGGGFVMVGPPSTTIAVGVLLAIAAHRRWVAPRPRWIWWALIPVGVLSTKAMGAWGRHGIYIPYGFYTVAGVLLPVAVALTAILLARRRGGPIMVVAGVAGFTAGWLVPSWRLSHLLWPSEPLPVAVYAVAIAAAVTGLSRVRGRSRNGRQEPSQDTAPHGSALARGALRGVKPCRAALAVATVTPSGTS